MRETTSSREKETLHRQRSRTRAIHVHVYAFVYKCASISAEREIKGKSRISAVYIRGTRERGKNKKMTRGVRCKKD